MALILSALCKIWVTVGNKISIQGWSVTKTETLVECATFYSNLAGTLVQLHIHSWNLKILYSKCFKPLSFFLQVCHAAKLDLSWCSHWHTWLYHWRSYRWRKLFSKQLLVTKDQKEHDGIPLTEDMHTLNSWFITTKQTLLYDTIAF